MPRSNFLRKLKRIGKILTIWKMALVLGIILKITMLRSTTNKVAQVFLIEAETLVSTVGISFTEKGLNQTKYFTYTAESHSKIKMVMSSL